MKRIILLSFLCLLLLSASLLPKSPPASLAKSPFASQATPSPVDHGGKIETKYDGFNHETVVTLRKMRITCGTTGLQKALDQSCVSISASLHCPGVQLDYVRYAKLQLIFETKDWTVRHPFEERELFVVADGERLKLGRMSLVDQLLDEKKEVLEVPVSYDNFIKIAKGQTIDVKVGKSVFALQEKNLAALRDLNNRVKLSPPSAPAG